MKYALCADTSLSFVFWLRGKKTPQILLSSSHLYNPTKVNVIGYLKLSHYITIGLLHVIVPRQIEFLLTHSTPQASSFFGTIELRT